MRYPHLILDLNGTLVDTFEDLTVALNETLDEHGRHPLEVELVRQWSGLGLRGLLRSAFCSTGPTLTDLELSEVLLSFRDRYARHLGTKAYLYPGVLATLVTLADTGVHMSLLTNKPQAPSLKLLEQFGIAHFFDYVVAGEDRLRRKPDPSGLLQLIEWMQARPDATLMVGSTRIDLETARHAGIRCALVDHAQSGLYVRGMGADFALDRFEMLVSLTRGAETSSAYPLQ
ncbi:MAG: HAD family hydrolase [Myxococcota bacterium]